MFTEVTWRRGNIVTEIVTEITTSESASQLIFIGVCHINDIWFTYIHFFRLVFHLHPARLQDFKM